MTDTNSIIKDSVDPRTRIRGSIGSSKGANSGAAFGDGAQLDDQDLIFTVMDDVIQLFDQTLALHFTQSAAKDRELEMFSKPFHELKG